MSDAEAEYQALLKRPYAHPTVEDVKAFMVTGVEDLNDLVDPSWTPKQKKSFVHHVETIAPLLVDRQQARRGELEAHAAKLKDQYPPLVREAMGGLRGSFADVAGIGVRALDKVGVLPQQPSEESLLTTLNRMGNEEQQALDLAGKDEWVNDTLRKGVRGAARSIGTMGVMSPLGGGGMIGGFAASRTAQAVSEAREAGLTTAESRDYVGKAAIIEGGVAAVFQRFGLGGAEKVFTEKAARGGIEAALKQFGAEIVEENITEILDAANQQVELSTETLRPDQIADIILNTTVQTAITMGTIQGSRFAYDKVASGDLVDGLSSRLGWAKGQAERAVARAKKGKGGLEQNLGREIEEEVEHFSPEALVKLVEDNEELARAIAAKETPSRSDFEGFPKREAEDRARMAAMLRDVLAGYDAVDPAAVAAMDPDQGDNKKPDPPSGGGGLEIEVKSGAGKGRGFRGMAPATRAAEVDSPAKDYATWDGPELAEWIDANPAVAAALAEEGATPEGFSAAGLPAPADVGVAADRILDLLDMRQEAEGEQPAPPMTEAEMVAEAAANPFPGQAAKPEVAERRHDLKTGLFDAFDDGKKLEALLPEAKELGSPSLVKAIEDKVKHDPSGEGGSVWASELKKQIQAYKADEAAPPQAAEQPAPAKPAPKSNGRKAATAKRAEEIKQAKKPKPKKPAGPSFEDVAGRKVPWTEESLGKLTKKDLKRIADKMGPAELKLGGIPNTGSKANLAKRLVAAREAREKIAADRVAAKGGKAEAETVDEKVKREFDEANAAAKAEMKKLAPEAAKVHAGPKPEPKKEAKRKTKGAIVEKHVPKPAQKDPLLRHRGDKAEDVVELSERLSELSRERGETERRARDLREKARDHAQKHGLFVTRGRRAGQLKKSAKKAQKAYYDSMIRQADELLAQAASNRRSYEDPIRKRIEKADAINLVNDESAPRVTRLAARVNLHDAQGESVPEALREELAEESRKLALEAYPDANESEIEQLAAPVVGFALDQAKSGKTADAAALKVYARMNQSLDVSSPRRREVRTYGRDKGVYTHGFGIKHTVEPDVRKALEEITSDALTRADVAKAKAIIDKEAKRAEDLKAKQQAKWEAQQAEARAAEAVIQDKFRAVLEGDLSGSIRDLKARVDEIREDAKRAGAVDVEPQGALSPQPVERRVSVAKDTLRAVKNHQHKEATRYAMNGVRVEMYKGKKVAAATDGKRLIVVPYDGDQEVGKTHQWDRKAKAFRHIGGVFPPFDEVVPDTGKYAYRVKATPEFVGRLRGAVKAMKAAGLDAESGAGLLIFSTPKGGVAINAKYALDSVEDLARAGHEVVEVAVNSGKDAVVFETGGDAVSMVMPLNLDNGKRDPSTGGLRIEVEVDGFSREAEAKKATADLTDGAIETLRVLVNSPQSETFDDLAELLGVSASTARGRVRSLRKAGLADTEEVDGVTRAYAKGTDPKVDAALKVTKRKVFKSDAKTSGGSGAMSVPYSPRPKGPKSAAMNVGEMNRLLQEAGGMSPKIYPKLAAGVSGRFRGPDGIALDKNIFIGPRIDTGVVKADEVEIAKVEAVKDVLATYPSLTPDDIEVKVTSVPRRSDLRRITLYEKDEEHAGRVFAHEIGHWIDYMPDETTSRGNILGRLATLRRFLKSTLGQFDGADKKTMASMRRQARKIVGETTAKPGTPAYKAWQDRVTQERDTIARKRGLLLKKDIEAELKALTRWWNPFDPAADESYTNNYRYSSKELYAEAISVLLNEPAQLRKRAPIFFATWNALLGRKPEVKAAYEQLVQDIHSGVSASKSREKLREGFRLGEERERQIIAANRRSKDPLNVVGTAFVDRHFKLYGMIRAAKAAGLSFIDPRHWIDAAKYTGSMIEEYEARNHEVATKLEEAGVSEHDFGEYLFYKRALLGLGDQLVANPVVGDQRGARQNMAKMEAKLGSAKMDALEDARRDFRAIREELILGKLDNGPYTKGFVDFLRANEYYTRFEVVEYMDRKGGKGHGLAVIGRHGSIKEVSNPWAATMTADMRMLHTLNWNRAKESVVDFLNDTSPGAAQPADTDQYGSPRESSDRNLGLIAFMRDGKLEGYYVDKPLADAFGAPDATVSMVANLVRTPGHVVRMWLTILKPGFQVMNSLFRDPARTIKNTPGLGTKPHVLYKHLFESLKAAGIDAFGGQGAGGVVGASSGIVALGGMAGVAGLVAAGPAVGAASVAAGVVAGGVIGRKVGRHLARNVADKRDPVISTLRNRGDLISWGNVADVDEDTAALERFLNRHRTDGTWNSGIMGKLAHFYSRFLVLGSLGETANKRAGYVFLKENQAELGWSDEEVDHAVRHWVGSPSFITGGSASPVTNNVWLFSNAQIQGWRSDIEAFNEDRVGVGIKRLIYGAAPKLLALALASGALEGFLRHIGADDDDWSVKFAVAIRSIYARVSEYDMANYTVVPLGLTPDGRAVYLRLPQDDTDRVVGGAVVKLLSGDHAANGFQKAAAYAAAQTPGLNPALDLGKEVFIYLTGGNPYDDFRERKAVPDDVRLAGGMESHKVFSEWLWKRYGGTFLYQFDSSNPADVRTAADDILRLPFAADTVGRFIKISDYGLTQKATAAKEAAKIEKARERARTRGAVERKIAGEPEEGDQQILFGDAKRAKRAEETFRVRASGPLGNALKDASREEAAAVLAEFERLDPKNPQLAAEKEAFAAKEIDRLTAPSSDGVDDLGVLEGLTRAEALALLRKTRKVGTKAYVRRARKLFQAMSR